MMFGKKIVLFSFVIFSCSTSTREVEVLQKRQILEYSYNDDEIALMQFINSYRDSMGLHALSIIDHISYVSAEHNQYMIRTHSVNHDGFVDRSEALMKSLGAVKAGENVAYNFKTNKGVFRAWLNSPSHRKIIEDNFTHFGLSIMKDTINERKYYTNIFIKILK